MRCCLVILLIAASLPACAARFNTFKVAQQGERYKVYADVHLEAPLADVRHVLFDFDHLRWINAAVQESHVIRRLGPDTLLVYVKSTGCFAFFCHDIIEQQIVREISPGHLFAEAIPTRSNVKLAHTDWLLSAENDGTHLIMEMVLVPDFAVPPLVGPQAIRHFLDEQGRYSARNIEKLAREHADLPPLAVQ